MNNGLLAEAQTYQVRPVTTRQNNQRTSNVEFQDAVQRYELRRSSKPRQTQNNQQTTVESEGRNSNQDLQVSRQFQRVLEEYQVNSQNSHNQVNKWSVKEAIDKYRRGRGKSN